MPKWSLDELDTRYLESEKTPSSAEDTDVPAKLSSLVIEVMRKSCHLDQTQFTQEVLLPLFTHMKRLSSMSIPERSIPRQAAEKPSEPVPGWYLGSKKEPVPSPEEPTKNLEETTKDFEEIRIPRPVVNSLATDLEKAGELVAYVAKILRLCLK